MKVCKREGPGRFMDGMIRLMGHIEDFDFLRNEAFLSMFQNVVGQQTQSNLEGADLRQGKYLRKQRAYDLDQLKAPAKQSKGVEALVKLLAGKNVFFRGYTLQCPYCLLETWYDLPEVAESMTCKGCRQAFQMNPQCCKFSYLLNQLFVEGLSSGNFTTLLLTSLLYRSSARSFMWKAGYSVKYNGKMSEIDLVAMSDGFLVFAECKDAVVLPPAVGFNAILRQMEHDWELADAAHAHLFLVATLQENIPDELQHLANSLDERSPTLRTRVVERRELLNGRLLKHNANEDDGSIPLVTHILKQLPGWAEVSGEEDPNAPQHGSVIWA